MNKITKKLFLYFTILSLFLSVTVFVGFFTTFRYYTFQHQEQEIQARAEIIKERIESFLNNCNDTQELESYIKVLDDISLADAYFVTEDGDNFTCACSCGLTLEIEKKPTEDVQNIAEDIFAEGEYLQKRVETKKGSTVIYAGIPVKENGVTTAAVVIVDMLDIDQGSFRLSIMALFVCLVVALLFAIILAAYLARHFMRPIHKIANAIKSLANGNYEVKTEVTDTNEIGVLAKETDTLADRLAAVNEERIHMEQMQKDYIANVAHELRTPVTVIRSSVEALYDGMVPQDKMQDYHKQMLAETISLQRLVNDMLELVRLENKDFLIEKEEMDMLLALEDAIRSTRLIANQKSITVHYECIEAEWMVQGDYGRLKQMFIIALDNAVKYSDEKSHIWIDVKQKADYYYVSIQDEGCGISAEAQKHIFDKFYRSTTNGGSGLGLPIMKNIAKRHEIDIRINSVEGKGTKIVFIIPIYKCEEINDK